MAAGTFGVPFWLFALAVFLGRCVRMAGIIVVTVWWRG
jgi:membrane protein YqaA with SNARE-associated domain